jgi:hypothetical protein
VAAGTQRGRDGGRLEIVVADAAEAVLRRLLDLDPGLRELEISAPASPRRSSNSPRTRPPRRPDQSRQQEAA